MPDGSVGFPMSRIRLLAQRVASNERRYSP
jgi:hypothetical protein